jgi:hypothetical protein
MSEFAAVPEFGLEQWMSAWQYLDLYRDTGWQFKNFFCPFCEIPLIPRVIYEDRSARVPHFAHFKGIPHIFACDGRPRGFQPVKREKIGERYEKIVMLFPQKLAPRRDPRYLQEEARNVLRHHDHVTEQIVRERRKGGEGAVSVPTSSNLANFVYAYDDVLRQWGKKNNGKKIIWNEIDAIREKMPLELEDSTNYKDGFRCPKYIYKARRIYFNKGTVSESENEIRISCSIATKYGADSLLPFYVSLDLTSIINSEVPRWHIESLNALRSFVESGEQIKWYAYGLPQKEGDIVVLRPASMDHIHFCLPKQKNE